MVTYHRNWVYFAKVFGLKIVREVDPKPGIPPSPKDVQELITTILLGRLFEEADAAVDRLAIARRLSQLDTKRAKVLLKRLASSSTAPLYLRTQAVHELARLCGLRDSAALDDPERALRGPLEPCLNPSVESTPEPSK